METVTQTVYQEPNIGTALISIIIFIIIWFVFVLYLKYLMTSKPLLDEDKEVYATEYGKAMSEDRGWYDAFF
jgi:hypothetical protein